MATTSLNRGKTLPNSGTKNDLHELIDLSTVNVSNIVNADIDNSAAIEGSKISPNFGSQDVICGDISINGTANLGGTLDVTGVSTLADLTVDGTVVMGGTELSRTASTTYQAETDGFFYGIAQITANNSGGRIIAYRSATQSDVDSELTSAIRGGAGTARADGSISQSAYNDYNSFKLFVKKDEYYRGKSASTGSVTFTYYWQPLG